MLTIDLIHDVLMQLARLGLFRFDIGSKDTLVDWLSVDSLVDANLLAAQALSLSPLSSSGHSFFISDSDPINNTAFLVPLCEELGIHPPSFTVDTSIALKLATFLEFLYKTLAIPPLLTRAVI